VVHAWIAFLGAFLLFSIQPFIGKTLTPFLGGGAQVWITCMFFFQICLLIGYAYAHFLVTKFTPRLQRAVHASLLLTALAVLLGQGLLHRFPLDPGLSGPASSGSALWVLLKRLSMQMALPLVALSATSPLIQAWFAVARPEANPYRLYAASNLGSLGGLLSYPFLAERFLSLPTQGWVFLVLFLGLLVLPFLAPQNSAKDTSSIQAPRSSLREISLWTLTASGGCMILMAGSTYLSSEVAAIPLLWVLPLALYLITFILVFETGIVRFQRSLILVSGSMLALSLAMLIMRRQVQMPGLVISGCLGIVFFGALLCHGCLYALRPPPERLTAYFLAIAAGGVVGGVLVAIVAPLAYNRVFELPVSVTLAGVIGLFWASKSHLPGGKLVGVFPFASLVVGLIGIYSLANRPGDCFRDFYGTVRVVHMGRVVTMNHGNTRHGAVRVDRPSEPLTYYHAGTAVGQMIGLLREQKSTLNVGVVGLGVGSLANYGRPGDHFVFYEISPVVLELAGPEGRVFSLLRNCAASVEVVPGDARISLDSERQRLISRKFDLLVIDAFSSDAVPWHLLTLEAFQLYFDHLKPEGILALHISTPQPLDRVVCTNARALDVYGMLLLAPALACPEPDIQPFLAPSYYALLSRQKDLLNDPRMQPAPVVGFGPRTFRGLTASSKDVPYLRNGRPWTDARSSLSDLLFERLGAEQR